LHFRRSVLLLDAATGDSVAFRANDGVSSESKTDGMQ
jgi:hypothetical protein